MNNGIFSVPGSPNPVTTNTNNYKHGCISFTTPGTYIWEVPLGVTSVLVYVVGGGGGGGGAATSGGGGAGGGGGGGGVSISTVCQLYPGQKIPVIVGSGGGQSTTGSTSSFGTYLSSTGGTGGGYVSGFAYGGGSGGTGGSGFGGYINLTGSSGYAGSVYYSGCTPARATGSGGTHLLKYLSIIGYPGSGNYTAGTGPGLIVTGAAGTGCGAGGAGGNDGGSQGGGGGGAGAPGAVLIEW